MKSQSGSRQSETALRKQELALPHLLQKRLSMEQSPGIGKPQKRPALMAGLSFNLPFG